MFRPLTGNRVFMFVCGPTVYDYSHVGHARVFVFFDTVAKWLRKLGYSVFYIVNITDVDDKIVNRAADEGTHPLELARRFESAFLEDMASLNVTAPNLYARASDYLKEIFEQIKGLISKGYAYVTPTGVYFDITKFGDYGKLSRRKPEELRVHRIEPDSNKRNPGDFALWRVRPRTEFGWESPWGYGRPGWHIEDTAITIRHFGPQYDIHGGAVELIFPHHEAEVAQAEAYTGVKPFVNYWVHVGLLTVDGVKMSKSLGNYVTVRDALSRYSANALRIFILQNHYRKPVDFSWELLDSAAKAASKVEVAHQRLMQLERVDEGVGDELAASAERVWEGFAEAMNNDFNTPVALSHLYDLASSINDFTNKHLKISAKAFDRVRKVFEGMAEVMGLTFQAPGAGDVEEFIKLLVDVRSELRARKVWDLADMIRERLKELGVELQDSGKETRWVIRR
ncbi:MAG: cysteine--tRNA ligase [Desulfurococcales archaeon]|nr:cysteine--tRNA ligase [Desulfurococcales archaeon]